MTKPQLLLIGAGGHAKACIDVIELEGKFSIAGLVGSVDEVGNEVLGYPVLGSDVNLPLLLAKNANALIVVGQIKSPDLRIRLFQTLKENNCALPAIVSPLGYVSKHAKVGNGTIVMHGAIVNSGAVIGANCIINSQALIEHDVHISDHCHIATSAVINSGVNIAAGTFVGSNSSLKQTIAISERSIIGMGESVRDDILIDHAATKEK